MRRLGFYGQDDFGIKDCKLSDLEKLIKNERIKVVGESTSIPQTDKSMVDHIRNVAQMDICPKTSNNKAGSKVDALMADSNKPFKKGDKDESYVIDLCDEVLGYAALRQHRFDFLCGDTGRKLPVDAFYKELNIVVEYHEMQHTQDVKIFDKRMTVSGVNRKEQRRIYDERRAEILPKHGIKLIVISYTDFGTNRRIKRNKTRDLEIVRDILKRF